MSDTVGCVCRTLLNSAMIKINLLKNGQKVDGKKSIGTDQAEAFGDILASHPTLKSLCGLDPDATEADFSNQGLESDDAILIAHSIKFNTALRSFTFSGDGNDSKPATLTVDMTEADLSGKDLGSSGAIMAAAFLGKMT